MSGRRNVIRHSEKAEPAQIPKDNRFDVFNADSNIPVIQWKNKKPVFKNYSMLLDKMGLDKLFTKIVNPL